MLSKCLELNQYCGISAKYFTLPLEVCGGGHLQSSKKSRIFIADQLNKIKLFEISASKTPSKTTTARSYFSQISLKKCISVDKQSINNSLKRHCHNIEVHKLPDRRREKRSAVDDDVCG